MAGRRRGRSAWLCLVSVGLLQVLAGAPAHGHIVFGTRTMHQLMAEADVVARARIVAPDEVAILEDLQRRPVVRAELLEVLVGPEAPGPMRFAQHGHGVAEFEAGEEVLLFLKRIERHRELAGLAGSVRYVSLQEHDAKFALTPDSRDRLLSAARSYASLASVADPAARRQALREATLAQLASGDPRLASGAVQDLVLDEGLLNESARPAVEAVVASPDTPIGVRIALVAELERRGLVPGPARWVGLLHATQGRDRLAVIRALASHPSPPVVTELVAILEGGDAEAAAAAAVSLGVPGNETAVPALARALSEGDRRLRMAAIRALGRIATASARRTLEQGAEAHPDPDTRRRARAEVELLGRGEGPADG